MDKINTNLTGYLNQLSDKYKFVFNTDLLNEPFIPTCNIEINPFQIINLIAQFLNGYNTKYEKYYMDSFLDKEIIYYMPIIIYHVNNAIYYIKGNNNLTINKGEASIDLTLKEIYKDFQKQMHHLIKTDFYLNQYHDLDFINPIIKQIKPDEKYLGIKHEESSMSLVLYKDEVLVLKTTEHKHTFPKGHIENNETPVETAIRECMEEAGVKLTKDDFLFEMPSYSYEFNGANFKYMTNDMFNKLFNANKIDKKIYVNVFRLNKKPTPIITETNNFIWAKFINMHQFISSPRINAYPHDYENIKLLLQKLGEKDV